MSTPGVPFRIRQGGQRRTDGLLDPSATLNGIAARRIDTSRRHPREVWRDRLARDLERFLRDGGEIEVLPGPGMQIDQP